MEITNSHLVSEFRRIKIELIAKKHIKPKSPLSDDDQMFAHLIAVYDATKNLTGG